VTDWAVNKCGGTRWRTLPDSLIEVEGEGVPVLSPTDKRFELLARTWANWASYFRASARANHIPISWLVAIATVETGGWSNDPQKQATIGSPVGAVGIMQFMPNIPAMFGFTAADRTDPQKSIEMGARFLALLAKNNSGQLPLMAASYNHGHVACDPGHNEWNLVADANYPRQALLYNNTAIRYLDLGASAIAYALAGIAFAGAAVVGYTLLR
jgi:soluble lytic murein transglycosylase-like protein